MIGNAPWYLKVLVQWTLIPGLFGFTGAFAQVHEIKGKVVDAVTGEPLAFVHITANEEREGTTTDIDGSFSISSPGDIDVMHFSYLGYELKSLRVERLSGDLQGHTLSDVLIKLMPGTVYLKELVFKAGENPANLIVRKAVDNKQKNNPENLPSFSYHSYNKFIVDADIDSSGQETEGAHSDMHDYLQKRYLFLIESVTERKYKYPDRSKEIVLASRVSGLQRPLFTALVNTFQPFSFYDDYLSILGTNYLNPLSKNSDQKYFFWLQDSIFSHGHKVYIISFEPKKKHFDGLKGILYINTYQYALENVIAETTNLSYDVESARGEPAPQEDVELDRNGHVPRPRRRDTRAEEDDFRARILIRVQQKYDLIDGTHWFPLQLNTDIEISNARSSSSGMLSGKGRSYLRNIRLFDEIKPGTFDRMAVEYHPQASKRDSAYWSSKRIEPLSARGRETYRYLDSVGRAENLDRTLLAISTLTTGKIPVGFLDIDADRVLDFNLYEKVRLGVGVHTNDRFSEVVTLGGYGAWAFGDRNFKYGGDFSVFLTRKNNIALHGRYSKDVEEPGGRSFYKDNARFSSRRHRRFMIERMDMQELVEGAVSFYALKYLDAEIALRKRRREPAYNYAYTFENETADGAQNVFDFTEVGVGLKYAFRERFVEVLGNQISLGTDYPTVWINYTRGFDGMFGGQYKYWKLDVQIRKKWLVRGFGEPAVALVAGIARGDLPYPVLYNGNGSYEPTIPLEAENTFQTMRVHEFASDRFISVYYTHTLGKMKWHPRISTPQFILATSFSIGDLVAGDQHWTADGSAFPILSPEKGYFESGIIVRDVYKFMGILGFGVGYFYRYGHYALDDFVDNSAVKITVDLSL